MQHPVLAAFAAFAFVSSAFAQIIQPIGHVHPNAQPLTSIAEVRVPVLDRQAINNEDEQRHNNGMPARYAIPNAVAINPTTHGTWEVLDATWSLWRLRINAAGASHVNLGFEHFFMPPGARMQVYSSDYTSIVRPFDASDHCPAGQLWTPVVLSDQIVVEVYVPTAARPQVQLDLIQIGSGYRFFGAGADALGTDISGSCNVDVACPQGAAWVSEIPAIAAISTGGSVFCSGSMINNTALDGRNFFLTANHCGVTSGAAPSLVCYWNYQNNTCGGGGAGFSEFTTGSVWRASYTTSDFTLVELNSTPNPAWGVMYAGWSHDPGNATSATCIHHPSGDAKKITFDVLPTTTTSYGSNAIPGNSSHVRVTQYSLGTTEPGSSGSPLFDQNHHIIGQLHGGGAACGNLLSDWYGRFAMSWAGGGSSTTRLSNWLDPLATGQVTLDTYDPANNSVATATSYGTGCYTTYGAFAQLFPASTFDLSGTAVTTVSLSFTPTANGYTVANGANAWFNPVAANLGLGDDALATLNLPFAFGFPGGSTSVVKMCSNGFVWLNGTSTDTDYTPTAAELASGPARLCPLWMDLNPAAAGSCHYDIGAGNTAVYLTWNNVPAYSTGAPGAGNNCQLVLYSNGAIEYRYRLVPNQPTDLLVGYGRGATATPANIDISTSLPISVSTDSTGLTWTASNRPILGTTQTINLTGVPNPAGSIGLVLLGAVPIPPGLSLQFMGAPGCFLYLQFQVIETLFPLGASTPWHLSIPNTPSLNGAIVETQGAALIPPGTNSFGLLTANRVELKLGTL